MNLYQEAFAIKDRILHHRRTIHAQPELGFDLPNTVAYVKKTLEELSITPRDCGRSGVTALVGKGEPVLLLRGDMDALPMKEETNLPFASQTGACHSCGHDAHTAILLGVAELLKNHEDALPGTVKLMFQPGEELLQGAKSMLEGGLLEDPKVDAAIGLHIHPGEPESKTGNVYLSMDSAYLSGDAYRIKVEGLQAHGSTPEKGVDAIVVAAHIVLALENIIARETAAREQNVVLVGKITGGDSVNTMAGTAELEVSIRATDNEKRRFLCRRVEEISRSVGETFRAVVTPIHEYGSPALVNDESLAEFALKELKTLLGEDRAFAVPPKTGSEDFAFLAEYVPTLMLNLGVGSPEEGYTKGLHHPGMILNEDALPVGVAALAYLAMHYKN